jgi:hypothetical protein
MMFVFQLHNIPLKDMFCEENPLLQHLPVHSVQEEEVLSLKVSIFPILYFSIKYWLWAHFWKFILSSLDTTWLLNGATDIWVTHQWNQLCQLCYYKPC